MDTEKRLNIVINGLCNGRRRTFCRLTGILDTTLCRIIKGDIPLTEYYVKKICNAFPQVNKEFLMTGEGEPGDVSIDIIRKKYENELEECRRQIETMRREIETQRLTIEKLVRQ